MLISWYVCGCVYGDSARQEYTAHLRAGRFADQRQHGNVDKVYDYFGEDIVVVGVTFLGYHLDPAVVGGQQHRRQHYAQVADDVKAVVIAQSAMLVRQYSVHFDDGVDSTEVHDHSVRLVSHVRAERIV